MKFNLSARIENMSYIKVIDVWKFIKLLKEGSREIENSTTKWVSIEHIDGLAGKKFK